MLEFNHFQAPIDNYKNLLDSGSEWTSSHRLGFTSNSMQNYEWIDAITPAETAPANSFWYIIALTALIQVFYLNQTHFRST